MNPLLAVVGCVHAPEVLAVSSPVPLITLGPLPDGRELFTRTWVPADPRSHGGDGLGPAYNAESCVACHGQGGAGGAGGAHADVQLVVQNGGTSVVHRVGGVGGEGATSIRSTPALFGDGLVEAIPAEALADAASAGTRYGTVSGRPGVGHFGWKADVASLRGFVAKACAVELGLETPEGHQPGEPALGVDMDAAELDALVGYVVALPRPVELNVPGRDRGREVFATIGCAACHVADLGGVSGLYSDLLLHDFGPSAADAGGTYYGAGPQLEGAAIATEWRTPPLWGLRDSAPYLHDGRARTVRDAIREHDGEAAPMRDLYEALPIDDLLALDAFLLSLAAPPGA